MTCMQRKDLIPLQIPEIPRQRQLRRCKRNMTLERIHKVKLFKYALYSRLILIFLGFLSNVLIPDHNADAFVAPKDPDSCKSTTYRVTDYIFGGFLRWDAQYFQHIARHGYTYENSLAFFPLFPMVGRGIALIFHYICPINLDAVITLTLMLLNILFFIWALMGLYDLTRLAFNDRFAYITGCLFIINPATIFFIAPYTESMYAYLTFEAIYHCTFIRKGYNCIMAVFYITLTALTRSNGLLNIGYLIFFLIQGAVYMFFKSNMKNILTLTKFFSAFLIFCTICMSIPILFFLGVQFYHYFNFCTDFSNDLPDYVKLFGPRNNFTMPGEHSRHNQTWCYYLIPLSYGYVQEKYWGLGFMRYYEWKQIPNFLLAFPVLFIILRNMIPYLIRNCDSILNFGIFKIIRDADYKGVKCRNDIVMVCSIHATFLTIFCIFFVHIQISTRMILSANPAFYWICAYYFTRFKIGKRSFSLIFKNITREQLLILTYFFSYTLIGIIMFCNYLPWT